MNPGFEPIVSNVSVGDLAHDGTLSVVATSTTGTVYVFNANGTRRAGWPKTVDLNVTPPPDPPALASLHPVAHRGATARRVLADVDATGGTLEIVQAGWDGYVHVWRRDGTSLPGWPVKVTLPASETPPSGYTQVNDQKLDTVPAVADLDGDRKPEILVHSQYTDVTGSGLAFAAFAHCTRTTATARW